MERSLEFSNGSASFTLEGNFGVTTSRRSALQTKKLFRSNSVAWPDGRHPREIFVKNAVKKYSDDATGPNPADLGVMDIRESFIDTDGTLSIDGRTLSGTYTLVKVNPVRTIRQDEGWQTEFDLELIQP